eukprot:7377808-Prymnesium_polylepis.1
MCSPIARAAASASRFNCGGSGSALVAARINNVPAAAAPQHWPKLAHGGRPGTAGRIMLSSEGTRRTVARTAAASRSSHRPSDVARHSATKSRAHPGGPPHQPRRSDAGPFKVSFSQDASAIACAAPRSAASSSGEAISCARGSRSADSCGSDSASDDRKKLTPVVPQQKVGKYLPVCAPSVSTPRYQRSPPSAVGSATAVSHSAARTSARTYRARSLAGTSPLFTAHSRWSPAPETPCATSVLFQSVVFAFIGSANGRMDARMRRSIAAAACW